MLSAPFHSHNSVTRSNATIVNGLQIMELQSIGLGQFDEVSQDQDWHQSLQCTHCASLPVSQGEVATGLYGLILAIMWSYMFMMF